MATATIILRGGAGAMVVSGAKWVVTRRPRGQRLGVANPRGSATERPRAGARLTFGVVTHCPGAGAALPPSPLAACDADNSRSK